jgi:hypothetical protein
MHNPRTFLCYAPRAGLRCAVAYLANERDAYGWFTGLADGQPASAYFVLENFYSPREPRYVSVAARDLHSKWTRDEARCHELAELQEAFSGEWLFSRDDPRAAVELERYAEAELAAGEVGVRFERLNHFSRGEANWTCYSHDCEHAVLKGLARRWPLDYRVA